MCFCHILNNEWYISHKVGSYLSFSTKWAHLSYNKLLDFTFHKVTSLQSTFLFIGIPEVSSLHIFLPKFYNYIFIFAFTCSAETIIVIFPDPSPPPPPKKKEKSYWLIHFSEKDKIKK